MYVENSTVSYHPNNIPYFKNIYCAIYTKNCAFHTKKYGQITFMKI